jgi:putative transcriptional regulator
MSVEINNSLKVWRAKFDLTQAELADKVEVTRKTINTLERGIYTPSVSLALKIAKVFNTQVEEVFTLKQRYIFQRNT